MNKVSKMTRCHCVGIVHQVLGTEMEKRWHLRCNRKTHIIGAEVTVWQTVCIA